MSAAAAGSAAFLAVALLVAAVVVGREARRTGLGLAHPGVPWLGLHAVFFGLGGIVLALTVGATGQAVYTGLAAVAFAGGLSLSATAGRRRHRPTGDATGEPATDAVADARRATNGGAGARRATNGGADVRPATDPVADVRPAAVVILAAAAVLLVIPTLLGAGIPFLTTDITGARAEVTGLAVQPLRVALPALAVSLVLLAALLTRRSGTGLRSPADDRDDADAPPLEARRIIVLAVIAIAGIGAFDLLLASRYFLAELAGAVAIGWLLGGGRIPGRIAVLVIVVGAGLFGGVGLLRAYDQAQGRELAFVAERTVNRVLLVQPRTLDAIMTAIPADQPFLAGLGWVRRLGPLLGRDIPNLGYWIYPHVVDGPQAVAGYAAPGLIGEAWANLGWFGVALFAALGAVAERLAALIRMRPRQSDRVAAALLVLFVARTHALGLGGLAVLVVLVVAWRLIAAPGAGLGRDLRAVLAWRVASS